MKLSVNCNIVYNFILDRYNKRNVNKNKTIECKYIEISKGTLLTYDQVRYAVDHLVKNNLLERWTITLPTKRRTWLRIIPR